MANSNEKLNNGCLKIFKFLDLLYEDIAYYEDVINIFKDEVNEQSENNLQVVLNKHINTLKVFGIKIVKQNGKYILESGLFTMGLSKSDLKSISILSKAIENFPDEKCKKNINDLIEAIKLRINNDDKNMLTNLADDYNFPFYYQDIKTQIETCKKICENCFLTEITYKKNKKIIKIKCKPQELVYDTKTVYILVHDTKKYVQQKIPLPNILNIVENHSRGVDKTISMTVVFRLKGKLAKIYRMRPHEYLRNKESDGSIVIVNKDEPFDELIARLMRYMDLCEIISPQFMRDKMIETINETLKKYKEGKK